MGSWSEQQEVKKEVKEKDKVRREKLAGLFFDLAKLSFAGLVVGGIVSMKPDVILGKSRSALREKCQVHAVVIPGC